MISNNKIEAQSHELQIGGKSNFPESIDINPTAICNLACSFCWGPDHTIADSLSTQQWRDVLQFFQKNGTTSVVFTGGEPLVRKDIGELVKYAKEDLGLHVTLSTNALLLRKKAEKVLPYVDEIGIPLDGSTPERNQRMRRGNPRHFDAVIDALALVKRDYPHIEVTVRTVVSKVNREDISAIGEVLRGHIGEFDRWKIYQFAPVNYGEQNQEEHDISLAEYNALTQEIVSQFPQLPLRIYPTEERTGRYVFVGPEGNIFGVGDDGKYQVAGNILTSSEDGVTNSISGLINPRRNRSHAQK